MRDIGQIAVACGRWLRRILLNPGFWFILVVLLLITLVHYNEVFEYPPAIASLISTLDLNRHAFERVLYLAPIVWAGFVFNWKGAFVTSLVALACMLPRATFISEYPRDAFFESGAVFVLGNVLAISFHWLRKEREQRLKLEMAREEMLASEERYRDLFANALDAIWIHDLEGNTIAANRSTVKLSGYSIEQLTKMNVRSFMSEGSLNLANQVRSKLLANEPVEQPYEQHLIREDGSEIFVQLATSLVLDKGEPVAFQHIARDVTEQKRLQENLRFYLRQATQAQEEERKRISHELHDDTIQGLIVLSRKLDAMASNSKDSSKEDRLRLEELWQQTDNILRGVRRLSQDLRPAALDRLGLLPALEWLASDMAGYSGIEMKVNVTGEQFRLPEEVAIALFRITQEALRNVWRHSGATKTEIKVEFDEGKVVVAVTDNGKGFGLPEDVGNLARHGKLGLAGMQERAQLIGGVLVVQSVLGKGTTITVEVPINIKT